MPISLRRWVLSLAVCAALGASLPGARGASDGIFPATTPEARKAIGWESGYFVINGERTFLTSGEIHFARVPRELWKERILRAKAMGLNTIQTYVMWNAHEGREGQYDFSGNLDLDAWLSLIQECGMYAIVRPGPYVCAEWEEGGLPAWLCSKPGMRVRENDPQYLKYMDPYMTKVYEIIAKHQIHKGGNVLMVQLENEYANTWGTDTNPHLTHLNELARKAGLEVPLFNSGLHHGNDPAGTRPFGNRTVPWYSTEFWTGWIGLQGDMTATMMEEKVRGTWKIIAFGGGGYDYYVVHGGTNFGYSKGDEVTASYDYSSPIGEAGQLRKAYFPMKRAAMFAQAFSDLLTSSKDGASLVASNTGNVQTYVRTGANGTAVFLADAARAQAGGRGRGGATSAPQASRTQIKLADGRVIPSGDKTLRVEPGEIRPILADVVVHQDPMKRPVVPVVFDYAATAILTRIKLGETTYVVCYGAAGEEGEVLVKGQAKPLTFKYPAAGAVETVDVPGANVKLLVMNTEKADRTWIVGSGEKQSLVIGADYASPEGMLEFKDGGAAIVFSAKGRSDVGTGVMGPIPALPKLENWQIREGAVEAWPQTSTEKWAASKEPKPMELYDDYVNGWGWYRTTIRRDAAGEATLRFTGAGDVVRLFVNGQRVTGDKGGATLNLKAGDNEVAALCWTEGRPKMYNFTGATGMTCAKGIWGPVLLVDKALATITNWRMLNTADVTAQDNKPAAADFDDSAWAQVRAGSNTMNNRVGYAWFRATFDVPAGTTQAQLMHQGMDDEGEFFLNGQAAGRHTGWNVSGQIDLSKALKPGRNVLAIRVRNTANAGGIAAAVSVIAGAGKQEDWKFHPGLATLQETPLIATVTNWKEFLGESGPTGWLTGRIGQRFAQAPTFHRVEFTLDPFTGSGLRQVIALRTTGLRAGSVWFNGHNLGPYKNTGNNATAMYIPECWLQKGGNTLVIFDAEGAEPSRATLEYVQTGYVVQLAK
jgi:beta-galactosidase